MENHGFTIVAVEADWPDAAAVNRYLSLQAARDFEEPAFRRFPTGMWRNSGVQALADWLRTHNETAAYLVAASWGAGTLPWLLEAGTMSQYVGTAAVRAGWPLICDQANEDEMIIRALPSLHSSLVSAVGVALYSSRRCRPPLWTGRSQVIRPLSRKRFRKSCPPLFASSRTSPIPSKRLTHSPTFRKVWGNSSALYSRTSLRRVRYGGKARGFIIAPEGLVVTEKMGDWVVAIGNPLGLGGTAGIVAARSRGSNAGPCDDFIQTYAA